MPYRDGPSSPDTMLSRLSQMPSGEMLEEQPMTSLGPSPMERSDGSASMQPLTGGDNVTRVYAKWPHYLPLACFALLLNPVLGIPAVVCGFLSRAFRGAGKERMSSKCSRYAFWLSLIAIASSVVIVVFVIVYVIVITPNIIRSIQGLEDLHNNTAYPEVTELEDMVTSSNPVVQ